MSSVLQNYFLSKIENLSASENTKSYIVSTFSNNINSKLFNKSLTIHYSEAKFTNNFQKFQDIADHILILDSIFPESLNSASKTYYHSLAQVSYYRCYLMINKQWKLFEELSDCLPDIIEYLQNTIIIEKEIDDTKLILP